MSDSMGDKIKGVAKETAGRAIGDEDLEREGEAAQESAQKEREAERLEQEAAEKRADSADAKADEMRRS
ncbi:CsbD family protein [Egicoccus sp. AB-alg2]|uniref:CsbD family protein n=1 Tax=Egicoccus sp. AB-alg2 TaxID=3242693 RepID=UPI00359D74DC